jgi:hypothetical protein
MFMKYNGISNKLEIRNFLKKTTLNKGLIRKILFQKYYTQNACEKALLKKKNLHYKNLY